MKKAVLREYLKARENKPVKETKKKDTKKVKEGK